MKKFTALLIALFMLTLFGSVIASAKDEAESLWELGEKAYEAKRYQEAILYYEKSLARCAGNLECVASNKNGFGRAYESRGDYKKALSYYGEALRAARQINHRDFIATNLFNVAAIYNLDLNQYEKALPLFEESLKIFRELNDRESIAIVLHHLGKAASSLSRYEMALSSFNESIKINRELNNQQGVAANLNLIGNVYSKLGRFDKPLSYYEEALRINRQTNNFQETAITLRNIGAAYFDLHKHDKALSPYEEALDMQKKHNLKHDMAVTLTNMGSLYSELNQYDKALSYFEQSLKISKEIDNSALIADNLNNIGHAYAALGKSERALSYYRQSLNLEKQLNRLQKLAVTLNNIGMEYFRLEQYGQALYYLTDALKIEKKLDNPHNIAARLNNIGAVYLKQKRLADAERIFIERKGLEEKIKPNRLIHSGLIHIYLETQRYNEALALLKELPPSWRDNRNRRMEYHTQYGMALKGKGKLRESASELLKAVSIVEEIRHAVSEKGEFFAGGGYISRLTPHRELAAVLSLMAVRGENAGDAFKPYGKDIASVAFYFSEMTKARTLLEAMAGSAKGYDYAEISPDIKAKEESILKQFSEIENNWESAFKKGEIVFNKLLQRKEELTRELNSLISVMRKKFPAYAALHYPSPLPAEELPLRDREVLIEFGISSGETVVFMLRKGGVKGIQKINISADELARKVKEFIEPFSTGNYDDFSVKAADELYNTLLADVMRDVKEGERIIIVPDGILGLLPFEALVKNAGKDYKGSAYMGDKFSITYSQSATALALNHMLKPSQAKKPLFALGNPVYDKEDPRYIAYKKGEKQPLLFAKGQKQYAYRGVTVVPKSESAGEKIIWEDVVYAPLPESEDEVKEIAKLFGVQPEVPDILLGVSASETNFKKTAFKNYHYLHFATHADLPGKVQGLKESFIILGQVENKGDDDGFLTLSETLELKLDADMVVLSACSTGKGKIMEGEGVANFARAFQYAGARSVVVSLWEVASEPAVEYMKTFYGHLKSGKSRAEALKLARSAIKAKYPNPFYWAPFILYGEG